VRLVLGAGFREWTRKAHALLWTPRPPRYPFPISGGSENTFTLWLTGYGGVDSLGRSLPKLWNTAGTPPAGSPLPSVNAWGGSKYTAYFNFSPGTGATLGTANCQIETARGVGADAGLNWIPLGGAFTQVLSSSNKGAAAPFNGPLAKVRLNITALAQSTNGDATLDVELVETHD